MVKGFLDHQVVKAAIFYVCTICLIVSMVASILSIWEVFDSVTLHRCLSTFAVVFFGSLFFLGLNLCFGSLSQSVTPEEHAESPFGDRMKRAKDLRGNS